MVGLEILHSSVSHKTKQPYSHALMQYSRRQTGGSDEKVALYIVSCVHVMTASPINSKPGSQV